MALTNRLPWFKHSKTPAYIKKVLHKSAVISITKHNRPAAEFHFVGERESVGETNDGKTLFGQRALLQLNMAAYETQKQTASMQTQQAIFIQEFI